MTNSNKHLNAVSQKHLSEILSHYPELQQRLISNQVWQWEEILTAYKEQYESNKQVREVLDIVLAYILTGQMIKESHDEK